MQHRPQLVEREVQRQQQWQEVTTPSTQANLNVGQLKQALLTEEPSEQLENVDFKMGPLPHTFLEKHPYPGFLPRLHPRARKFSFCILPQREESAFHR